MSALPTGVLDIYGDTVVLSSEYAKKGKENCEYAAKKAKDEGDMENFSYYRGRIGVFDALLQLLNYQNKGEN